MKGIALCEESGAVSQAFRNVGIECWSCDILPTSGDAAFHIQADAISVAYGYEWDFAIMFPPCTNTAVSGARHFAAKRADGRQQRSLASRPCGMRRSPSRRWSSLSAFRIWPSVARPTR